MVLSSAGLDKAQQKQILSSLSATKSTITLTSAEAMKSLTEELGSKKEAKRLLIKSKLVTSDQLATGAKFELNKQMVLEAINLGRITQEEGEQIITAFGLSGGNVGLATSFKLLGKQIGYATLQMLKWLVTTPTGWATLVIGAVVGTTVAIAKYNEKLEESRQEMIETGKEAAQLTKDLDGLVEEYRKLGADGSFDNSDREKAKNIQKQINELLGEEVSNINLANADYKEQLKLLRDLQYEKAKEKDYDLETAYTSSKESLLYKADDVGAGAWVADSEVDAVNNLKSELEDLDKYIHTHKATGNGDANTAFFKVDTSSAEAVVESYEKMVEIKRVLEDAHRDEIQAGGVLEDFYNNLKEEINDLSDAVNKYKDAMSNYNVNQAVIMFNEKAFDGLPDQFKNLTGATIENKEQLSAWMTAMMGAKGVSDDIKYNLIGLAKTNYPELSEEIDKSTAEFVRGKISSGKFKGSLATVASQCGTTTSALATMILKMIDLNETKLNLGQQISEIVKLRAAMGLSEFKDSDIYDAGFKWVRKGTYALDGKEYTMDEARYKVIYDTTMDGLKKFGGDTDNDTPPYTSSGTKDKDKTNEALDNYLKDAENRYKIHQDEAKYIEELQWAHDNLTKSLDEQLDITGKINEAYRDLADNRIKDLEHQIDLTKELKGEDADVTKQLEEIQRVSHQEANRLRSMGYDDNSNEIQALQKTWWDAENQKLEWRLNNSKDWIEERNRLDDWHLFDDNEVKAWERVIKWLKEEYPHAVDEIKEAEESLFEARENNLNDVLDEIQRHADNVADYYDKINDKLDDRITKEEALLQIMQGQTDATSKLMDVQTEIDKALRDSKLSLQYLDEKERESIFNEKDYTKLSKLVKSTQNEIDSLSSRFYNDVIEAYEQDKAYLIESITAEYERQVAMKERELEIAQAQVDLTKKQLQLNNVLAEKNVKQLVERNGQYVWEWVADTDKVRQATEELMDAEAELKRQEYEQKQQEAIDEQQRRIDSIKAEQAANDYRVEKMNEYVDDLTKAIENCVDPIKSFEELAMQLGDAGGDIVAAFYNVVGSISGMGVKIPSTSSSSSGGSGGGNSWMGNGKSYDTKTDYMSKILGASNKMDVVEYNNARNNKIDGEGMSEGKLSSSQAIKLWESAKNKHADGTRYTPGGLTALGEEGFEAFINRNGNLIPIAQPTIGNIDSGGIVFNTEQMNNLRNLWDLSNIGKVNVDAALINRTIPSGNSGTQNTFTGGIIINAPRDYNDFVRQLTQRIKTKSI